MAFNSYQALQDSLAAWLNEADLVVRVPDFIALAEAVINRRVDHAQMFDVARLSFSGDRAALPADFLAVKSVRIDAAPNPQIEFVTLDAFAARFAQGGMPTQYTLRAGYILFNPAPPTTTAATLLYKQRIPPLSENGDNWLLDAFPDVYLYGALVQAAPYAEDEKRGAQWLALFERAVAEVNRDGQRQSMGGTLQTNNGQPRTF